MKSHACPCHRCGGMMIATYADLLSSSEAGEDVIGWRCVNCGEYFDRQVLLNRSVKVPAYVSSRNIEHRSIPQRARTIQVPRRA